MPGLFESLLNANVLDATVLLAVDYATVVDAIQSFFGSVLDVPIHVIKVINNTLVDCVMSIKVS